MTRVAYDKELREIAKVQKRSLFTVDLCGLGFRCQGMSDNELEKAIFDAVMEYKHRCKSAKARGKDKSDER